MTMDYFRRAARCRLLPILLPLAVSPTFADIITVKLQIAGVGEKLVRGLDSAGVLYLAVNDLASVLTLPGATNDQRRKFEMRLPQHRLKVSARSPFVVITDVSSNNATVFQFPNDVRWIDSMYFAPATPFIALFQQLWPIGITFDVGTRAVSVRSQPMPPAYDITGIEIEPRLNGYLLSIKGSHPLGDAEAWLKKPDGWLFVTIANARADTAALNRTKPIGAIRRIVAFQYPTSVQLTFRVAPDVVQADPMIEEGSNDLVISLRTQSELEIAELEKKRQEVLRQTLESQRDRWKLDVIVIDAGHGGKDPGTIGVNGTYEKDITLAVALKLGKLIEQNMKSVKVVYTRKTDKFVELYRRAQIANEAGGKLFISIHCNATERKPSSTQGFEIYLLRPGKTESAIAIAARENASIAFEEGYEQRYEELTEEKLIIATMAQSAFLRHSEQFAQITAESMAKQLNLKNSGVKQAGFYVLVGASMPNVLVETGYLSNRKEERILRSADGQNKIAHALFRGIQEYKKEYEKALQEGRVSDRSR